LAAGDVIVSSHLFHMLFYASFLALFFAVLIRDERRERLKFGATLWIGLVGGAMILAFLMAPG